MFHFVARTRAHNLFDTWEEAHALWQRLRPLAQGAEALCLMPNHVHILHPADIRHRLAQKLAGHVRALNRYRPQAVQLQRIPLADWTTDRTKLRRQARYIFLNPCRAQLVDDPLAWPWSTYRDAMRLALQPLRPGHHDPERLHSYVSRDPTVDMDGTPTPVGCSDPCLETLRIAASAALRVPILSLSSRGTGRTLWIQSARALAPVCDAHIARAVGVHQGTVSRTPSAQTGAVQLVARISGDPRFAGIPSGRGAWCSWR